MFSFICFLLCSHLAFSSVLISSVSPYFNDENSSSVFSKNDFDILRDSLFDKIKLKFLFHTHASPFTFSDKCIEIHNTHVWTYVGCSLPRTCGITNSYVTDKSFWGYEDVICFSFHWHKVDTPLIGFYDITVSPTYLLLTRDLEIRHPFPSGGVKRYPSGTNLTNFQITSFFDNYYFIEFGGSFSLLPRSCADHYLIPSKNLPDSVKFNLDVNEKKYSVSHTTYYNIDCNLTFYDSLPQLLDHFDYPISWTNGIDFPDPSWVFQYGHDSPSIVLFYQKNYKDFLFPISKRYIPGGGDTLFISNKQSFKDFYIIRKPVRGENNIPDVILPNNMTKVSTYYFDYHSKNKALVGSIFSGLVDIVADIFFEIFDALESILERIAVFIFKLFERIIELVYDTITGLHLVEKYYILDYLLFASFLLAYFRQPWPVVGILFIALNIFGFVKKNQNEESTT